MKKILIMAVVICMVLLIPMVGPTSTLGLKGLWDRNPETDLAGYNLYRTDGTRIKINSSLIGTTFGTSTNPYLFSIAIPNGSEGTLRFRLTAIDSFGNESLDSNEAPFSFDYKPPGPPTGFGITKQ